MTNMATKQEYKEIDGYKVPVIPNIHQAVYAAASQPGALDMDRWHTCKTTHCRAGWVVFLAGTSGTKLEKKFGNAGAAARLIYRASDPMMSRSGACSFDFCCSEEKALADMNYCAEQEAARQQAPA
jgi:hypothetical protein